MIKRILIDSGVQAPQLFIAESYQALNEIKSYCDKVGFKVSELK